MANECSEDLIRDVRDGSVNEERLHLERGDGVLREVRSRLRPDPDRAARLEKARQRRGGRLLPADYWPRP